MKTIKKKPRRASRAITVAQRLPLYATEAEISEIKRKYQFIREAATKTLPTAIEMGDWFLGKHKNIESGQWLDWLAATFPEIGRGTVYTFMELAAEKQFLAVKFGLAISPGRNREPDIQGLPSINEARKAIIAKHKSEKIAQPKAVDIESKVVPHGTNGEAERPMRIAPPVEKQVELEEEGTAFEAEDRPEEIIQHAIRTAGLHLRSALLDYQAAVNVARKYGISDKLIREGIEGIFNDLSDLLSPQDELKRQLRNLLR